MKLISSLTVSARAFRNAREQNRPEFFAGGLERYREGRAYQLPAEFFAGWWDPSREVLEGKHFLTNGWPSSGFRSSSEIKIDLLTFLSRALSTWAAIFTPPVWFKARVC